MSARTKIKPLTLIAIEHGAFEQLPGEFFTRAFLRTYARELHLPVDEVMADYDSTRTVPVVARAPLPAPTPHPVTRAPDAPTAVGRRPLAAVVVAGLIVLWTMTRPAPVADTELQPVATSGNATSASPPAAAAPVAAARRIRTPGALTIAIRPTRRIWVTGTADGKRVLYRTLEPGEEVRLEAQETMTFRLGDAGAFEYAINGVPGKPAGANGEVREFVIDRSNYRALAR